LVDKSEMHIPGLQWKILCRRHHLSTVRMHLLLWAARTTGSKAAGRTIDSMMEMIMRGRGMSFKGAHGASIPRSSGTPRPVILVMHGLR